MYAAAEETIEHALTYVSLTFWEELSPPASGISGGRFGEIEIQVQIQQWPTKELPLRRLTL